MRFTRVSLRRIKLLFVCFAPIISIDCTSTTPNVDTENSSSIQELEKLVDQQSKKIANIEQKLIVYQEMINDQSHVLDIYDENNETMHEFKRELNNEVQMTLETLQKTTNEDELFNSLNKIQKKIQILEDRTFYTDSLYFEVVKDIVLLENKISSLIVSFKEMSELSGKKKMKVIPKITDEEYTAKYIESLSYYQNAEWNLSLDGFKFLIQADSNHDLADNSQYWIGEVYYALNDYRRSIKEFEKVFTFPGTNKSDDAQYKLGLCYVNIGQLDNAKNEFKNLLEFYPNSEYYKKSQDYLQQY